MATRSHTPRARWVDTADGRRLHVEVAGDGRRVVVAHVGSPNAGLLYDHWRQDAASRGLTLIGYDRPGYGGSSPQRGRTVADCAADVRAIGAAVGFERCAVWGFSGGGPHALACAALLDDLVVAAATIGSPAPPDAPGLDYFAGMSDDARHDIELFRSDRGEWERTGQAQRDALVAMSAPELGENWSAGVSPLDAVALHGEFGVWLHQSVRAALAPGVDGWVADDVALFHSAWGFDPTAISIPVKLWHSRDDRFVPWGHGCWLADAVPGAQADLRDDDGHLTVVAHRIGDVHEWLAKFL
jgi:pimeloyl-ACP methyl ester carboxylesterase